METYKYLWVCWVCKYTYVYVFRYVYVSYIGRHMSESCHTWDWLVYSKWLQHTATHCNTLQHTATHCTTPQHTYLDTAMHHDSFERPPNNLWTLQHTATHRSTLQHTLPHCNTHTSMTPCNMTRSHTNSLQIIFERCNTLQQNPTHCNTLQHTATHSTTLQHTYLNDAMHHDSVAHKLPPDNIQMLNSWRVRV